MFLLKHKNFCSIIFILLFTIINVKSQVTTFPYTEDFDPNGCDGTTSYSPSSTTTFSHGFNNGVGASKGAKATGHNTDTSYLWISFQGTAGKQYQITFDEKTCSNLVIAVTEAATFFSGQFTAIKAEIFKQQNTNHTSFTTLTTQNWVCTTTGFYYFVFKANATSSKILDNIKITETIACTAPTTPATATGLTLSNATKNSLTVNWNSGNGTNVLVTAMDNATAKVAPASSTIYTANPVFGDNTKTTGAGNYVVYNGTNATSLTVTGLIESTTYTFYVYPYNISPGTCYLTTTPYTFTAKTLDECNTPLSQASYINFPSKTKTDVTVNWTNGSGDHVLVVARKVGDIIKLPIFGTIYTANATFGSGQATGSGNFVVYNGTGTSVNVTGLTESTSYTFDIYTYYAADNCYKKEILAGSNEKTVTTKSDFYNIKDLDGTSITTCDGKVVDGGGVSGNYTSGAKQTLTINPESSTDGSCLTFTQWDLAASSEVTFFDGATKIYTALSTWDQTNNDAPKFKGPGLVCASPGNPLKIEFDPNGSGAGFTAEISCYTPPKPCEINVSSIRDNICKGESVELIADGFVGASLLNNNFNSNILGTDWSTLINPRFDNKCNPGMDATYFWTSTDPKPRDLTSKGLDVSQGGSVAFDLRLAAQSGEGELGRSQFCEGPEKIEEGVYIEYSIDGTTWVPMHYFFPAKATNGGYSAFNETTSWQRYYFEIPKGAQTKNTKFRWIQYEIDDDINDVWGLDRINITAVSPFKIIWKDKTNGITIGTSGLNEAPYKVNVSPTATTTYEAQIIDAVTGQLLCSKPLTINVGDFTVTPTPESVCGASDGKITFSSGATGTEYSINNGLSYLPSNVFTGLKGGTYDVVYKSATCTASKKVTISSASGGPNVVDITDIAKCVDQPSGAITFTSTPVDAAVTYKWSIDNTNIGLTQTARTGNILSFPLTNLGTTPIVANFEVVPEKNGCVGKPETFTITVKPKDDANFIVTDYCAGSKGAITITGVAGGTFTSNITGPAANTSNTEMSGGAANSYVITYTTPLTGCSNQSTQTLKINAPVAATFDYADFCETDPTISGGGATNILKTGGTFSTTTSLTNSETINSSDGSITKGKGGTSYNITYTPPSGSCYSVTQKTIKVKALEQIALIMPDICIGSLGKVTTATPVGGSFNFVNPPANPATTTINNSTGVITGAVATDLEYEVSYKSLGTPTECANTKFVKVKPITVPTINIQPQTDTQCEGKKVKFSVKATNGLSYAWEEKSTASGAVFSPITYLAGSYEKGVGNKDDTLVIIDNTTKKDYEYRVIVGEAATNSVCPITSTSGKILFKLKEAAPLLTCDNALTTTSTIVYDWSTFNGSSTATSFDILYEYTDPNTSSVVTLSPAVNQAIATKKYTLSSLSTLPIIPKNFDVKITVTPKGPDCYEIGTKTCTTKNCQQPIINSFTSKVEICENVTSTKFEVNATANLASNALTYAWHYKTANGTTYNPIVSSAVYDMSIPNKLIITPSVATRLKTLKDVSYKVVITENGCIKDTSALLKVDTLNIGGTLGIDTLICKGSNSGLLTLKNNAGDVIKWQSSISPFTIFTDISPLVTSKTYTSGSLSVPTRFRVVVKSGLCPEVNSLEKKIDTISSIGGVLENDTAICFNQPAGPLKLKNNIGNVLKWQYSNVSNPSWSDITNTSNTFTSGKLKETSYFRAVVQKNTCPETHSTLLKATVNPLPIVNPKYTAPCEGNDLKLEGNLISGATYTWKGPGFSIPSNDQNPIITNSNPSTHDGKYTLIIKDGNKCIDSLDLIVAVNPTPSILNTPLVVCEKSILKLQANHSSATTNAWSVDNANSTLDLTKNEVLGVKKGTSKITFTDDKGCKKIESLTIESLPIVNFASDVSICIIDSFHTVDKTTPNNCSLSWNFGDGTISSHPGHKYSQGGIYSIGLTAKTLAGCVDSIRKIDYLEVIGLPDVKFTFKPDSIDIFEPTIEFTNNSDAKHYKWVFGDGKPNSLEKNPMHIYPDKADEHYDITLTGYNTAKGCQTSLTKTIIAKEPIIYYIPNTFTPNNDEVNNTFKPIFFSGLDIFNYNLTVFNRWGEIVFVSNNVEYGWDGTFGNKMVESGTYIWRLEFKEKNKYKKYSRTGHVNILK
jgi:gliding motility-associated-like protein